MNVQGFGVTGGPNEHSPITLNGWVGPLDPTVGCDIHIVGENLTNKAPLFAALNAQTRQAISAAWERESTAVETGPWFPQMHGKVICDVTMPIGIGTKPTVAADIIFDDISGRLSAFPYPLRHLAGMVKVRETYFEIDHVQMEHNGAALAVDGRVSWQPGAIPGARLKTCGRICR